MAEREEKAAELMVAIQALPKPVTAAQIIEKAVEVVGRVHAEQFTKWFEANGSRLLERLNG